MDAHCILFSNSAFPYVIEGGVQFILGAARHHLVNKSHVLPIRKYKRELIVGCTKYIIDGV